MFADDYETDASFSSLRITR